MPRQIFEATEGEGNVRFRIHYIVRNFVIYANQCSYDNTIREVIPE